MTLARFLIVPFLAVFLITLAACESVTYNEAAGGGAGGAVGGFAGSRIGSGSGKAAAAATGAVLGVILGVKAGQELDKSQTEPPKIDERGLPPKEDENGDSN